VICLEGRSAQYGIKDISVAVPAGTPGGARDARAAGGGDRRGPDRQLRRPENARGPLCARRRHSDHVAARVRRVRMVAAKCLPPELVGFQRWVVRREDLTMSFGRSSWERITGRSACGAGRCCFRSSRAEFQTDASRFVTVERQ
jgi:hypothetical protein